MAIQSIYLRTLRAFLNKAIKEDISSDKHYSFKRFSLAKYDKIKTENRAISKEEIIKIKNFDTKKYPHLLDAKTYLCSVSIAKVLTLLILHCTNERI